jgi:hypothetical protein
MVVVTVMVGAAGTAWAQPPIVGTEVTRWTEGPYSDESTRCQTEIYTATFSGQTVEHFTYFPETGALHFHDITVHGTVEAVPLDDPTLPSYTGHFMFGHSENIRNVKGGELVQVHTGLDRAVLKGSDGSRAFFKFHAHFTVNANGVKTVDCETERLVCS